MSDRFFGFSTTQKRTLQVLLDEQTAGSIGTAELANDAVTAAKLADNAVVNANVDAAAAIAATKIAVAAGTDGLGAGTLQAQLQALATKLDNVNDWAIALATKLNNDAGVTDVNYDTDPQA